MCGTLPSHSLNTFKPGLFIRMQGPHCTEEVFNLSEAYYSTVYVVVCVCVPCFEALPNIVGVVC